MNWRSTAFCTTVLIVAVLVLFVCYENSWQLLAERWFITPLAVVAAAFANATAVGGGFLFVPLFIFSIGLSAKSAMKLSIATQAFGIYIKMQRTP